MPCRVGRATAPREIPTYEAVLQLATAQLASAHPAGAVPRRASEKLNEPSRPGQNARRGTHHVNALPAELAPYRATIEAAALRPDAEAIQAEALRWRLVWQIDSDRDAGFMWGDLGRLYLLMKDDDLAARHFDRAWLTR
jgi:hypothetical protein